MTSLRYLISIPPFTDPTTVVAMAVDAELAGWDGVFVWDHLHWSPEIRPPVYDPWVLLGAIAHATSRVRIGTLVTPLTRRRLQVVAKHLVTLDHLSGGRVTFAVGLGEPATEDFANFGDEADRKVRGRMLDEGLAVLDGLLRGDAVHHAGEHYSITAQLRPGPVQQPRPPIWVAGVAPNRLPLERARRCDGLAPIGPREFLTPEALAAYLGDDPNLNPPGWDVVAEWAPGHSAQEYADAGATWLVESTWPVDDWVEEFRGRIRQGPRN